VFYPKQGTQLGGIPINETRWVLLCSYMIFNCYGPNTLPNYDITIIYTEIDARYDHRIKKLQDVIDQLELE
jgi:hypothetical protein